MRLLPSIVAVVLFHACLMPDAESGEGLIPRLAAQSQSRLAVDQTRHQLAVQQLNALHQLKALGHASASEVAQAKATVDLLEADLAASRQFSQLVDQIAVSIKSPDETSVETVLLQIGDFADDPGLHPLAGLGLPSSHAWREVAEMVQESSTETSHRSEAWAELLRRVRMVDDGELQNTTEQTIIDLKRQLAIAEESFARHSFLPVQLGRKIDEVQISNRSFATEVQLVGYLSSVHREIRILAASHAFDVRIAVLQDMHEQLAFISRDDPAFRGEAAASKDRLLQAEARRLNHRRQWSDSEEQTATVQTVGLRITAPDLPPFTVQPTKSQLNLALASARQRIVEATQEVNALREYCLQLSQRFEQVQHLADNDHFFAMEAASLAQDLKIAESTQKATQDKLEIRRSELEFVTAVNNFDTSDNTAGITDWRTPLLRIFELRSLTAWDEEMIRQTIVKNETRCEALSQLFESGDATWKELEAARVQLADSQTQLSSTIQRGRIYGGIMDVIKTDFPPAGPQSVALNQ